MHQRALVSEQLCDLFSVPPFVDALKHKLNLEAHTRHTLFQIHRLLLLGILFRPVNPVP